MDRRGLAALLVSVAAGCSSAAPLTAHQADAEVTPVQWDRGPFRIRNQFPLNLHFLSFPGEDAEVLPVRHWSFALDLTTANVFVGSDDLIGLRSEGERRRLERAELADLVAAEPDRDRFLYDGGVTRLALLVRYGASDRVEVDLEIPFIALGGGELDGMVEDFHDALGIGQSGRLGFPRDRLQIALALGGRSLFVGDEGSTRGLGDLVISGKFLLRRETRRAPAASLRLALKPASGGSRSLLSSGHTDLGLNLALAKHLRRQSVYINAGYVQSGGWWVLPGLPIADVWTLLLAYERGTGTGTSFVIQTLTHSSFLADATRSDLADLSHEVTLGVKRRVTGRWSWAASLSENYAAFRSSPDFGVHLGVGCAL